MSSLVTAPSLTDQVYNAIVDDICTGTLPAGTRLRQETLAEQYAVSRQPVQQALLLLHSQGFLREAGRRGLEVAPMEPAAVDDLYGMRAVIEGYAARRAATCAVPADLERGATLLQQSREAPGHEALSVGITADIEFHQFVASVTGNRILEEVTGVVLRNVRRAMGEIILRSGFELAWDEHLAILSAIRAGDADRAEGLARDHAERGRRLVMGNAVRAT